MKSLIILLVFSCNAFANLSIKGEVNCYSKSLLEKEFDEDLDRFTNVVTEGEFCTYTIRNLESVKQLIRKLNQALFNGDPLTEPLGLLQAFGDNDQDLIFNHSNQIILKQMIRLIPMLDTKEAFVPGEVIRLNTDIYEVTDTGLSNLGAGITSLRIGSGIGDLDDTGEISGNQNSLGIDLKVGPLELSGLISREKSKGNLEKITSIRGETYNLNRYDFSDITMNYQTPGSGLNPFEEKEGIEIRGKLSINEDNNDVVVLKDFNFYYGIPNGDGTVNQLNIPRKRMILKEGILFPLVSSKVTGVQVTRSRGFLGFNNSTSKENKRLLVYMSVQVLTWEEFITELSSKTPTNTRSKFTKEEVDNLPDKCISDKELLDKIVLKASRGTDGEPQLSYSLDPEYACKKNIKKKLFLKANGGGIKISDNTVVKSVENLMLKPVTLTGIKPYYFSISHFKLNVMLSYFSKKRTYKWHNLVYANSTDYDISENFWID